MVYSEEMPRKPIEQAEAELPKAKGKRSVPGSVAFVPPVVGLIMGGEIVKDLLQ